MKSFEIVNAKSGHSFGNETTITGAESDLCERWLGSDWRSAGYSDAEAVEIAKKCQVKQDAGDEREYTAILAEVLG